MNVSLQIEVVDTNNKPASNALIVVKPSNTASHTNKSGVASLQVPAATKYTVAVTKGQEYTTVPLYLSNGQTSASLNVNLPYLKSIKQLSTPPASNSSHVVAFGGGIVIVLVVIAFVMLKLRKKKTPPPRNVPPRTSPF